MDQKYNWKGSTDSRLPDASSTRPLPDYSISSLSRLHSPFISSQSLATPLPLPSRIGDRAGWARGDDSQGVMTMPPPARPPFMQPFHFDYNQSPNPPHWMLPVSVSPSSLSHFGGSSDPLSNNIQSRYDATTRFDRLNDKVLTSPVWYPTMTTTGSFRDSGDSFIPRKRGYPGSEEKAFTEPSFRADTDRSDFDYSRKRHSSVGFRSARSDPQVSANGDAVFDTLQKRHGWPSVRKENSLQDPAVRDARRQQPKRRAPKSRSTSPGIYRCTFVDASGPCRTLPNTFKCQSELKKHLARHDKVYTCDKRGCPRMTKGFATINDLDRHRLCVHGEDPLHGKARKQKCFAPNCPKANKIWPRLDNFRNHLQRMHPYMDPAILVAKGNQWWKDQMRKKEELNMQTEVQQEESSQQLDVGTNLRILPTPSTSWKHIPYSSVDYNPPPYGTYGIPRGPIESSVFWCLPDNNINTLSDLSTQSRGDNSTARTTAGVSSGGIRIPGLVPCPDNQDATRHSGHNLGFAAAVSGPESELAVSSESTSASKAPVNNVEYLPPVGTPRADITVPIFENSLSDVDVLHTDAVSAPSSSMALQNVMNGTNEVFIPNEASSAVPDASLVTSPLKTKSTSRNEEHPGFLGKVLLSELDRCSSPDAGSEINPSRSLELSTAPAGTASPKGFDCPVCHKKVPRMCDLNKHLKRHKRPYGCTFESCHKTFGSKNDWKRHENSQHFQSEKWLCAEKSAVDFPARECGKLFNRREYFVSHLKDAHGFGLSATTSTYPRGVDAGAVNHDAKSEGGESCALHLKLEESQVAPKLQGMAGFWCGFCRHEVPFLKKSFGVSAIDERFDHIDMCHFRKGEDAMDWMHLKKAKARKSGGAGKKGSSATTAVRSLVPLICCQCTSKIVPSRFSHNCPNSRCHHQACNGCWAYTSPGPIPAGAGTEAMAGDKAIAGNGRGGDDCDGERQIQEIEKDWEVLETGKVVCVRG